MSSKSSTKVYGPIAMTFAVFMFFAYLIGYDANRNLSASQQTSLQSSVGIR